MPLKGLRLSVVVVLFGAALLPALERAAMAWTYIQVVYGWNTSPRPPVANARGNPSASAEGPVAHTAPPPPPPGPRKFRVILRDGTAVVARDQPRLVAGAVRFTDDRGGTLVAIKASQVDLAATAEANQIKWDAASPARDPAASPAKPQTASAASRASATPPR
jgi:hypothetical protein